MGQVLVRDLDPEVVARLKARAEQHGRSLQMELKALLEQAASRDLAEARGLAARMRRRLSGRKHSDSARLLARDRMR